MDTRLVGHVILLNGASSAGKSSIARELQAILDGPWLHVGVDHFLAMWPEKYFALNPSSDSVARQGFSWLNGGVGDEPWYDITAGPLGHRLMRGMHRAISALSAQGFNLIVDDVLLYRDWLDDYVAVLQDITVLFVGVRLPLDVLLHRERERGNRRVGQARGHYEQVHAHGIYDLEVPRS